MGNPEQKIIVVENNVLFDSGKDYFEGFRPNDAWSADYEKRIVENLNIMRRGDRKEPADHPRGNAELSFFYKQPIGYTVILNYDLKKVFAYLRSKKGGDDRLHGKWSWGFGGHIEPIDGVKGNIIKESILREVLREEVLILGNKKDLSCLGYINYDSDEVSRVHFGILYGLSTDAEEILINDPEVSKIDMLSLSDLEKMCNSADVEVEAWSRIAIEPLRKLL